MGTDLQNMKELKWKNTQKSGIWDLMPARFMQIHRMVDLMMIMVAIIRYVTYKKLGSIFRASKVRKDSKNI